MTLDPTHPGEPAGEVVYPVTGERGKTALQVHARNLLCGLLEDYFSRHRLPVFVGGNQFFYYKRGDPQARAERATAEAARAAAAEAELERLRAELAALCAR